MGDRDHTHIGVNIIYNLFPRDGLARRCMTVFADVVVLFCGLFMLYYGTARCLQLYKLPGKLPMTGLATWWQYLPIPLGGFFISFDSVLFLTGVLKRDDLLYTEAEVDYVEELKRQRLAAREGEAG
jgi:TRAP-type C4-dicarboxylate transport system permease small subunit